MRTEMLKMMALTSVSMFLMAPMPSDAQTANSADEIRRRLLEERAVEASYLGHLDRQSGRATSGVAP